MVIHIWCLGEWTGELWRCGCAAHPWSWNRGVGAVEPGAASGGLGPVKGALSFRGHWQQHCGLRTQ